MRWAYGGDFGETPHDGAFIADGVVFPDRTPKPVMYEHREIAAPVRLEVRPARGARVANHQHFRGLAWLAAEWELSLADGGTLTAPAELPDLRPGELGGRAAAARAAGGRRRGLADAAGDDGRRRAVGSARHRGAACPNCCCGPRRTRSEAAVAGPPVKVDADGLLVHPLLTSAPTLSLWRAPTDNDELGGTAAALAGLGPRPRSYAQAVDVRRDGGGVTVLAEYAGDRGRRPPRAGVHAGAGRHPRRGDARNCRTR